LYSEYFSHILVITSKYGFVTIRTSLSDSNNFPKNSTLKEKF